MKSSKKTLPHQRQLLGEGLTAVVSGSAILTLLIILMVVVPISHGARTDNVSGWAWAPILIDAPLTFRSGYGFTSFNDCWNINGQKAGYPVCISEDKSGAFAPYGLNVNFSSREITGWAWGQGVGWICFGGSCCNAGGGQDYCKDFVGTGENPEVRVFYNDSQTPSLVSGWAKVVGWADKGWLSLRGDINDGSGDQYGLRFTTSTLEINGLAWNAWSLIDKPCPDPKNCVGYGWFCVNEVTSFGGGQHLCPYTSVSVAAPFIQTTEGDVFSHGNVSPDLGAGSKFNATYLILANGTVVNYSTEEKYRLSIPVQQRPASYTLQNYPLSLELPQSSNNFFNALGHLDMTGLSETQTNKYGRQDNHTGNWSYQGNFSWPGYRIIINAGDLTMGPTPVTITSGATTFIVDGDLYIRGNISYQQSAISDLKNLPSIAFIVRGDVHIDPSVTEIAGNFVVVGKDGVNCDNAHCGRVFTGASDTDRLLVHGIMMAKKFEFERTYATVLKESSEQIDYDGRLLVNPPPGFQDFAKGLPAWGETVPK